MFASLQHICNLNFFPQKILFGHKILEGIWGRRVNLFIGKENPWKCFFPNSHNLDRFCPSFSPGNRKIGKTQKNKKNFAKLKFKN